MNEHEALKLAVEAACMSPCGKSKRGVVIFGGSRASVVGFNGPPDGFACDGSDACREACGKVCRHAEARALDRCFDHTDLLHVKVIGGLPVPSGPPSCWQCSRAIIDCGIKRVWLLHETGLRLYSADDFHVQTLENCDLPVIRAAVETENE